MASPPDVTYAGFAYIIPRRRHKQCCFLRAKGNDLTILDEHQSQLIANMKIAYIKHGPKQETCLEVATRYDPYVKLLFDSEAQMNNCYDAIVSFCPISQNDAKAEADDSDTSPPKSSQQQAQHRSSDTVQDSTESEIPAQSPEFPPNSEFELSDSTLILNALALDLDMKDRPSLDSIGLCIPLSVKHKPRASSHPVWRFIHVLEQPLSVLGHNYHNVCLLCAAKAASRVSAPVDAWKKGIRNTKNSSIAMNHMTSRHKHTALIISEMRARNTSVNQTQSGLAKQEEGKPKQSPVKKPRIEQPIPPQTILLESVTGNEDPLKSHRPAPIVVAQLSSAHNEVTVKQEPVSMQQDGSQPSNVTVPSKNPAFCYKDSRGRTHSIVHPLSFSPSRLAPSDEETYSGEVFMVDPQYALVTKSFLVARGNAMFCSQDESRANSIGEFKISAIRQNLDIRNCLEAYVADNPSDHRSIIFGNEAEMRTFYGAIAPFCPEQERQTQFYFSKDENIVSAASRSEEAARVAMESVKIIPMSLPHSFLRNGNLVFVTIPQHMRVARSQRRKAESAQSNKTSSSLTLEAPPTEDAAVNEEREIKRLEPSFNDELAAVCGLIKVMVEDQCHIKREPAWMEDISRNLLLVPEMLGHSKKTFSALGNWINPLSGEQEQMEARNSIDSILSAITMISNPQDTAQDVMRRVMPSIESVVQLNSNILSAVKSASSAPANTIRRSEAFKITAECIIQASSACLDQIAWFENAVADSRGKFRAIQEILGHYQLKLAKCQKAIDSGVRFLQEKHHDKITRSEQIQAIVYKHRDDFMQKGESEVFAELQAYNLAQDEVNTFLREYEGEEVEIKCRQMELEIMKTACTFYGSMVGLLECIRKNREQALEQVVEAQKMAETTVPTALSEYIPLLTKSSLEFYKFQLIFQKNAQAKLERKRIELDEHIRFFGDQVPSEEQLFQRQIREFGDAIENSERTSRQLTEAHGLLWKEKRVHLPSTVWDLLIQEYRNLWQQLSGPEREAVQQIVKIMNDEHLIWQ